MHQKSNKNFQRTPLRILTYFDVIDMMRIRGCLLFLLLPLSLIFFSSCQQYYLSICQEWVDVRYLASTYVGTPDPRQDHPPIGQMLILDWRVTKEIFQKNPEIVLDLIFWDYTTRQVHIPIKRRMDFATYRLFNEDYEKTGGILTYKAKIVTQDGMVFREWKHQLWVNLITMDQETAEPAGVEKAESAE
jgi:hypothetical protein